METKNINKIWDMILISDSKTGKIKLIPFPKDNLSIWDKIIKNDKNKFYGGKKIKWNL